jgi:tetratricopeptide (TPR) repeat protein
LTIDNRQSTIVNQMRAFRLAALAIVLSASLATFILRAQNSVDAGAADRGFRAAISQYQAGQYSKAAQELEDLARRIPPTFQVEELLGLVYSAEGKDEAANQAFAEAVRLEPNSAAARANLGVNLERLGRTDESEAEFKRALRTAPNDYQANQDLGEFYVRHGKVAEAIPYLAAAQRLRPFSYGSGYDLALADEEAGHLKAAWSEIQQLLARGKTAELYNLLAAVDEKSGNYLAAAKEYQQAVYMDPSEQNIFDWGSEFLIHHTWNAAVQVFSDGAKRYPNSAPLAIGLGLAYYWREDYAPAVKALMRAVDLSPSDPRPYYFLSHAYQHAQGEAGEVRARFRRFEDLEPLNADAAYYYAMTLLKSNQMVNSGPTLDTAESLLRKAVRINPSYTRAYLLLGNLYSQEHQYAKAVPEYQQALRLDPSLPETYYHLGQAYMQLGKRDLARKEFNFHRQVYARHLAENDRERSQTLKFVYSERGRASAQR